MLIQEVLAATGITATAGIGTNMFLCKVAMDIVAKHIPADKDGVRIAQLVLHLVRNALHKITVGDILPVCACVGIIGLPVIGGIAVAARTDSLAGNVLLHQLCIDCLAKKLGTTRESIEQLIEYYRSTGKCTLFV